jgi:hypothetical protein
MKGVLRSHPNVQSAIQCYGMSAYIHPSVLRRCSRKSSHFRKSGNRSEDHSGEKEAQREMSKVRVSIEGHYQV